MNIENTQSQMRKGVLEFCILSVIQRGEVYPSDIIEEMKKVTPLYRYDTETGKYLTVS